MRFTSLALSLILHLGVIGAGVLIPMGAKHIRIDLERPVYEVKLVSLPKAAPAPPAKTETQSARPVATPKAAPVQKKPVKPAPKPEPKPQAKEVSPKKKAPQPKPTPATKPQPKPKAPPEKTPEQVLAEALGDVRKSTPQPAKPEPETTENALAQALASVKDEVAQTPESGGQSDWSGYTQAQLAAGYSAVVGAQIRENWRFPPINQQNLVAEVEIRVGQDGTLYDGRILQSSGREDFDASILKAVESTRQVTPIPPYLKVDTFRITFRPESG